MNIIHFTMKNLKENRAFLAMLCFLFVFSCSKDKKEGNGDATKYTLSITKPTGGTLTSNAGGISCGSEGDDCKAEFSKGTEVTLTAVVDTGYILGAWQGNCSETGIEEETCQLSMDANKTAGKAFLARPTLSIDPKPINGTLTSDVGDINCGSKGDDCEAEFDKVVEVTLTATADTGYAPATWQGNCDKTAADQVCKLTMDANRSAGKLFADADVDEDNDGLIEIHDLDMFSHIQYNVRGTSYKTGADVEANTRGAPASQTDNCKTATDGVYLCGYELMRDLDFAQEASYADGSVNTDWRPDNSDTSVATNGGFTGPNNFAGIFEGNGNSITNLYSRGGGNRGLFRATTSAASIRNLGVVDANLYMGSGSNQFIGALVGFNGGSIRAGSATGGTVNNGSGTSNHAGGLVGRNNGGNITASSVTDSTINGSSSRSGSVGGLVGFMAFGTSNITASHVKDSTVNGNDNLYVGGLVGYMFNNTNRILASYVKGGTVNGGVGNDYVGGLVGAMLVGTNNIIASSATGAVNGGAGIDYAGGLVGYMDAGTNTITASYATGAVNGGAEVDFIGGLVGRNDDSIIASYATGATSNGTHAGDLIGSDLADASTITKSYGFGSGTTEGDGKDGDAHPSGVTDATDLTSGSSGTGAGSEWDDASGKTKGAWDFGTTSQNPALKYADYDGDMAGVDYCDLFPPKIPGTDTNLVCDTTPLPGQGR